MDEYNLSDKRRAVIETAMSLVGKCQYSRWYRQNQYYLDAPSYLDCSSFVSWVYLHSLNIDLYQQRTYDLINDHVRLVKVPYSQLQPGDICFSQADGVHVIIYLGPSAANDQFIQIIDCTDSNKNNVGNVYYRSENPYDSVHGGYLEYCYKIVGIDDEARTPSTGGEHFVN